MRAPGTAPQPAAPTRCGSNLGLRAGSSPAPPAQNKNPKAEGGKAPEAWERENKARPAQLASHNAGPGAAAPPPPALPRTAPAGSSGRRLGSPTGPARPRVRRESARHKSAAGTGRDKGEGGAGSAVPHGPAAYGAPGAPRSRAGACGPRCPRGRRGRAGVAPRCPPPSPAGGAGRERRRRFTTGPGGREAPHAAACSAAGYIYPARSLPRRARPSQSERGARPRSDAGWPTAVRRRAER